MGYAIPANVPISATWTDHRNRNPPSSEPGTDYATAYGTQVACAEAGTVTFIDTNPGGGEGRCVGVTLNDGRYVRYLHMDRITVAIGQGVRRGDWLGASGASGNGSNYGYGPHVHVSLWERPGMSYGSTIDFQQYTGDGDDDMGTIDNTDANRQVIKDAVFQFMLETNGPPSGYDRWPFMAASVWNAPVQAQDGNGQPLWNPDGTPVLFSAGGFAASTGAGVNQLNSQAATQAAVPKLLAVCAGLLALLILLAGVQLGVVLVDNASDDTPAAAHYAQPAAASSAPALNNLRT